MTEVKKTSAAKAKNEKPENPNEKPVDAQAGAAKVEPPVETISPSDQVSDAGSVDTGVDATTTSEPPSVRSDGQEVSDVEQASVSAEASTPIEPASKDVAVYPLRSYLDAGEIKRRAGPSYTVPRRHAEALIARGLASTEKPKA